MYIIWAARAVKRLLDNQENAPRCSCGGCWEQMTVNHGHMGHCISPCPQPRSSLLVLPSASADWVKCQGEACPRRRKQVRRTKHVEQRVMDAPSAKHGVSCNQDSLLRLLPRLIIHGESIEPRLMSVYEGQDAHQTSAMYAGSADDVCELQGSFRGSVRRGLAGGAQVEQRQSRYQESPCQSDVRASHLTLLSLCCSQCEPRRYRAAQSGGSPGHHHGCIMRHATSVLGDGQGYHWHAPKVGSIEMCNRLLFFIMLASKTKGCGTFRTLLPASSVRHPPAPHHELQCSTPNKQVQNQHSPKTSHRLMPLAMGPQRRRGAH